ncbi:unnamed protein product [Aureobasidium pullulans]|nr:unnamed protein product [Aureobasidium pullulans]
MPDQTIKEHFDTIATALDAATTRAAGYSKTISMCLKENEWLRTTYKRYRTEKAQLGAENQTLRVQNDRLTEIIVKNANTLNKMQEEMNDLNFRLAGPIFRLSIRDKLRDKLSELDEKYRTSQSVKHFESMYGPRRIVSLFFTRGLHVSWKELLIQLTDPRARTQDAATVKQISHEIPTAHIANFEKENVALKIENQKLMISIDELKECIRAKDTGIKDLQEQLSSHLVVGGQGVKTVTQMEGGTEDLPYAQG